MRNFCFFIIGVLVFWACAQTVPVSGGPDDEEPPKILKSSPENFSTFFNGRKIVLEFDEFVEVKSVSQNVLVSPALKHPLEHKIRGKKVTFFIEDTLAENTTYIFNFGEAIVDYNEGNPLDSNLFVFSTGAEIDSLEIQGKLINAEDLKPVEKALAMLYLTDEDSLPYNQKPYFLTRADDQGEFTLSYLPQGEFKFFALVDEDMSYQYNEYIEQIGFIDSMIASGSDTIHEIRMFKEADSTLKVKDFEELNFGQAYISFSIPVDSFRLNPIEKTTEVPFLFDWNEQRDSVNLWLKNDSLYDTLWYELIADTIVDTINFKFKPREKFIDKKTNKLSVKMSLKPSVSGKLDYFDTLHLKSNHPIEEVNTKGWLFIDQQDTMQMDSLLEAEAISIKKDSTSPVIKRLQVLYPWQQNRSYSILIPDSLIYDMFGLTHDTVIVSFSTTQEDDYGEFEINFDFPEPRGQYLFTLMTTSDEVLRERLVEPKEKLVFHRIKPGKFKLRIIDDLNFNEKWDPGNYMKKRQAERVLFHPDTPEMRANWDLEIEWILEDYSLIRN